MEEQKLAVSCLKGLLKQAGSGAWKQNRIICIPVNSISILAFYNTFYKSLKTIHKAKVLIPIQIHVSGEQLSAECKRMFVVVFQSTAVSITLK